MPKGCRGECPEAGQLGIQEERNFGVAAALGACLVQCCASDMRPYLFALSALGKSAAETCHFIACLK